MSELVSVGFAYSYMDNCDVIEVSSASASDSDQSVQILTHSPGSSNRLVAPIGVHI